MLAATMHLVSWAVYTTCVNLYQQDMAPLDNLTLVPGVKQHLQGRLSQDRACMLLRRLHAIFLLSSVEKCDNAKLQPTGFQFCKCIRESCRICLSCMSYCNTVVMQ